MRQYQVFEGMADGLSVEDIATRYSMTIGAARHTQSRVITLLLNDLGENCWQNIVVAEYLRRQTAILAAQRPAPIPLSEIDARLEASGITLYLGNDGTAMAKAAGV
jgi:hypothetical protein